MVLIILVVLGALSLVPLTARGAEETSSPTQSDDLIPVYACFESINTDNYKDPQFALQHGVNGYIELSLAEDTLRLFNITGYSEMNNDQKFSIEYPVQAGHAYNFTLQFRFISYNPQIANEATVTFDPHSEFGFKSGAVSIDHRLFLLNDLIEYYPENLQIRNGETRNATIVITLPSDMPPIKIQLLPNGVHANFPIVNEMRGFIDVK